jgi:DNA-binding response OmpR family regulator
MSAMSGFARQALLHACTQRSAGKIARALTNSKIVSFPSANRSFEGLPRSLRILVADDERDTVLTLAMILRDEGHEVQGVYTGSGVLPLMREFDPDVALLDIALPEKSGFELAKEIRKRPRGQRVLLIGISGQYKLGSDKILADITGFDHYLVKPFDPAALLALIAPLTSPVAGR